MKIFFKFTKLRNFILVTEIVFLVTFLCEASQNTLDENILNADLIFTSVTENKIITLVSSSTFVVIQELKPGIKFSPIEKVRKGVIQLIYGENNSFVLKVGSELLPVENSTSTLFYFGDGGVANMHDIENGMKVYVFGYFKSDNSMMAASKIVIANKKVFIWKH